MQVWKVQQKVEKPSAPFFSSFPVPSCDDQKRSGHPETYLNVKFSPSAIFGPNGKSPETRYHRKYVSGFAGNLERIHYPYILYTPSAILAYQ